MNLNALNTKTNGLIGLLGGVAVTVATALEPLADATIKSKLPPTWANVAVMLLAYGLAYVGRPKGLVATLPA